VGEQLPHTLGELVRGHRLRMGITQRQLAGLAEVSIRTVRDIERDRIDRPRPRTLQRLTVALALPQRAPGLTEPRQAPIDKRLRVEVLGPLQVRQGAAPIEVGPAKLRLLLGLLAVQPGKSVSSNEIVDMLWGDRPPATCVDLVRTYVARLRARLEPERPDGTPATVLALAAAGYRLQLGGDQVDVTEFDELTAQARRAHAEGASETAHELFAQALRLWRGPVLADGEPRLRQHPACVGVSRRRLAAALAYADLAVGLGHQAEAAELLRGVAEAEELHEGLHARLMLLLAGAGQQAAALRLFVAVRDRLAEELGVEPGAEIQRAHRRVLRQELPLDRVGDLEPAAPAPVRVLPAQLPADLAAFTGRTRYLRRLDALLPAYRERDAAGDAAVPGARPAGKPASASYRGDSSTAVTIGAIVGTAGIGKTALAVRWAHRVRSRFDDGQLYVNLRGFAQGPPVRPIEALASFLRALGVAAEQVPLGEAEAASMYRSLLVGKRLLVILDNARGAEQVRPLLPGDPACLVLVTSRDRLGGLVARDGARRLTLDVLSAAEANTLLSRTIGGARLRAEPDAAVELAQLCARLPLALRIAAANLINHPHQGIDSYVAELRQGNLVASLQVDGDEQAAVRAAFDLSYTSLTPDTQRVFRLLGIFPGNDVTALSAGALVGLTTPQAAQALDQLATAHLVTQDATGRFASHDLLRRYAADRAHTEDSGSRLAAATHRLFAWYLHSVDAAARCINPEMLRLGLPPADAASSTPVAFDDRASALAWLDDERANLVALVLSAAEHGPRPVAWLLADALRGYLHLRMHVVDWLTLARTGLAAGEAEGDERAQAAARLSLGDLHARQSRPEAIEHYRQAVRLARQTGWRQAEPAAVGNLGGVYWQSGQLQEAADHFNQALVLNRRTGRLDGAAATLSNLGILYWELGRLAEAKEHYIQALAVDREIGARVLESIALGNLGEVYHALGQYDAAVDHLNLALALDRETGNRGSEAKTLQMLAAVHRDAGRHDHARDLVVAAVAMAREVSFIRYEADALNTLATVHSCFGDPAVAVGHHEEALRLARHIGNRYPEAEALGGLAASHRQRGAAEQAATYARQAIALSRRVGYRLLEGQTLTTLAGIRLDQRRPDLARYEAQQALAIHRETGYRLGEARALLVLGHAGH
jgi:DNA-binding SARP family transcriptional activator/tetratricopeptide (TPR) repeat protein/DNA-binding XRE family transcriptional regulator